MRGKHFGKFPQWLAGDLYTYAAGLKIIFGRLPAKITVRNITYPSPTPPLPPLPIGSHK